MNKNLMSYVRTLSMDDTKTRTQKLTHGMSEVGELAKVVLSLDDVPGSMHDIQPRQRVLEEACDVILVMISMACADGFSDEDIDAMLARKADKWANRQQAEGRMPALIPFEIHVSVSPGADEEAFRARCAEIGVKPLILSLEDGHGRTSRDMMTSSVFHGTNSGAMAEMERISRGVAPFSVMREKVETVPWHPKAPRMGMADQNMPTNCYFEAHLSVTVPKENLTEFCGKWTGLGAATSINARKRGPDSSVVMLTFRMRDGTREDFQARVANSVSMLMPLQAEVNTEFAVYDTDSMHDERLSIAVNMAEMAQA